MSIELSMRRVTPETYRQALNEQTVPAEYADENDQIAKLWGMLLHILANGGTEPPLPTAAQAIVGGIVLTNEPDDYGGVRAISPELVATVSEALREVTHADIRRGYETLDFAGVYATGRPVEDLLWAFDELRTFYTETAALGNAMIVWLG